jgi:hypothetical protein
MSTSTRTPRAADRPKQLFTARTRQPPSLCKHADARTAADATAGTVAVSWQLGSQHIFDSTSAARAAAQPAAPSVTALHTFTCPQACDGGSSVACR